MYKVIGLKRTHTP